MNIYNHPKTITDRLVDDQTTTRPSSNGEYGDSEGGWRRYTVSTCS